MIYALKVPMYIHIHINGADADMIQVYLLFASQYLPLCSHGVMQSGLCPLSNVHACKRQIEWL